MKNNFALTKQSTALWVSVDGVEQEVWLQQADHAKYAFDETVDEEEGRHLLQRRRSFALAAKLHLVKANVRPKMRCQRERTEGQHSHQKNVRSHFRPAVYETVLNTSGLRHCDIYQKSYHTYHSLTLHLKADIQRILEENETVF